MTEPNVMLSAEEQAARDRNILIAKQNDRFRNTWGADFTIPGQIVFTRGVAELAGAWRVAIMTAVQTFNKFDEDNDPYLDHTFGAFGVTVDGIEKRFIWKIDLYDMDFSGGSENPSDPEVTQRVLTIMFPSDW